MRREYDPERGSWLRKHQTKLGWLAVAGVVAGYDLFCDKGQTLSEGFDRARETKSGKIMTALGALVIVGHLFRVQRKLGIEWADPLHYPAMLKESN